MLFSLKRSFVVRIHSLLVPLHKMLIHPHIEYVMQASSALFFLDSQALKTIPTLQFWKGLYNVPYEAVLQRLRPFFGP